MMKTKIMEQLQDCSTNDFFQFSLYCQQCKRLWLSMQIPFSKSGQDAATEELKVIHDILRKREHEAAVRIACREVMECFSLCPICGHLVCDACFMVANDLDLCCGCANRLGIEGELVLERKPEMVLSMGD